MNPRDFQTLAGELITKTSPACIRTAISRAYYSVYNVGVELLRDGGFEVKEGPSGHGDVGYKLSNSGSEDLKQVGSQLSDLHNKRIKADYRLANTKIENHKSAQAVVQQAMKMIRTLDRCFSGPDRGEIIEAIKVYSERISAAGHSHQKSP